MGEAGKVSDWHIDVEKVIRDEFGVAIWIRLKYFKFEIQEGKPEKSLKHDLVFSPGKDGWPFVLHRIMENFVPKKRYRRMAARAAKIFSEKRTQCQLPK